MVKLIDLTPSEIVANAIILLNKHNGRRCITVNEYNLYLKALKDLAFLDNIFFSIDTKSDDNFDIYFDTIMLDDSVQVYRLKPEFTISMLRQEIVSRMTVDLIVLFQNQSLLSVFKDMTFLEEQSNEELIKNDESHQLHLIYEILRLEKKKRELELKLGIMHNNVLQPIFDEAIPSSIINDSENFTEFELKYHHSK